MLVAALALCEPQHGDWIWLGYLRLLATSTVLAPIAAVLGARWPGARAWNLIVVSLLVVFGLPVLEQGLLDKQLDTGRVGMDGPRLTFYAIIVAVGVANYLPTRFGVAATFFAAAIFVQLSAVGPWNPGGPSSQSNLISAAGMLISVAAWIAFWMRETGDKAGMNGAWLRFRDSWGLVWAARFRERWNSTAEQLGCPLRIYWSGVKQIGSNPEAEGTGWLAAEEYFRWLLRRFANPDAFLSKKPAAGVPTGFGLEGQLRNFCPGSSIVEGAGTVTGDSGTGQHGGGSQPER